MSSRFPRISIIIVGYNALKFLPDCLVSIEANTYSPSSITFLENGSSDGSIEYVRKQHPNVKVFQSEENLGFAAGNNFLITKELSTNADVFFVLNPDTILDRHCLENLALNFRPNTILQPIILLHENGIPTEQVNTWGNPLHYLGFSYAGGMRQPKPQGLGNNIALASGAAMFIPREAIEEAGNFDESLFLYHEDVDLSWRYRLYGYQICSIYSAVVWHKYEFSRNKQKFYYAERNRLIVILKNYQFRTLCLLLPMAILTEVTMLLYAAIEGWLPEKLKGYASIIVTIPQIFTSRKYLQKCRKLTDRELYPFLNTELSFSEVGSVPIKFYNILSKTYWRIVSKI